MKSASTLIFAKTGTGLPKPKLVDARGEELVALRDAGSLEQHFWWVVTRVREFEIGIDSKGQMSQAGIPMPANHLMCLLKKDFAKAFPGLSHKTMAVVLRCAVEKLRKESLKQLSLGEEGWQPGEEAHGHESISDGREAVCGAFAPSKQQI
jgi:hypothetical protein